MESKDFLHTWKKLSLSEEEREVTIGMDSNLDSMIFDQLSHCLVGMLLTSRTTTPGIIKNAFNNAWRTNMGLSVESLGKNLYLIKFDSRRDKEAILFLGPGFDKSLLALEIPKTNVKLSQMSFERVSFWIQFLDIPLGFQNRFMARKLGNTLGTFIEVDCDKDSFCWGEHFRIKVLIDITKPLQRGILIEPGGDQESVWICIQYKRLPDFCYYCGRIGHVMKDCRDLTLEKGKDAENFQFGGWLRFQGSQPRKRRRASPIANEKEDSISNFPPYQTEDHLNRGGGSLNPDPPKQPRNMEKPTDNLCSSLLQGPFDLNTCLVNLGNADPLAKEDTPLELLPFELRGPNKLVEHERSGPSPNQPNSNNLVSKNVRN